MLMLKGKIMKKNQMITLALFAAMLPLSACVADPTTGKRTISKAAIGGIGGVLGGYLLGDLIGGKRDRTEKIVGAGIGALAGAAAGYYMDEQEKKLRLQTAGTGVNVTREGDNLVLDMPSEVTFGVDSANIDAGFRNTLDQVASTLTQYEKTYVDVMGHTDSTGSDAYNQILSEGRASAFSQRALQRVVMVKASQRRAILTPPAVRQTVALKFTLYRSRRGNHTLERHPLKQFGQRTAFPPRLGHEKRLRRRGALHHSHSKTPHRRCRFSGNREQPIQPVCRNRDQQCIDTAPPAIAIKQLRIAETKAQTHAVDQDLS
jgi:hypothetical protein